METVEVTIYKFDELGDDAKDMARDWLRRRTNYPWFSESIDSIRAFVEHFGGTVTDWQLGDDYRSFVKTDLTNANFRGVKLADINRDYMPTGYCLDADLWGTFYQEFKRTSDALYAANQAIEAALSAVRKDIEFQYTDEAIDETLIANEYQFTEDGRIWK